MLSDRLAQLDGTGVVERDHRPGRPPRVRHELVSSGHRLGLVLRALRDWRRRPQHKTAELRPAVRQALFTDRPTSRLTCGKAQESVRTWPSAPAQGCSKRCTPAHTRRPRPQRFR
ncbi:winged helix-turn-helix transcriptional regulator [Streptomyces pimonensis]|uniref:Winged helix-turn-helix transcriptional regulator n=1 Tax=Streptomyces pimonensis TaxID=2860288 RepID=A0ABV4IVN6_9ACTN